jgi:hypothetical protein
MKKAKKNIQSPALSNTFPTSSSSSLSPSPSSIPITSNMASEPSIIVPPTVSISSALLKDNALASSTVRNTLQAMTQVIHTKQQQVQQQQQQEQLELTLLTALDDAVSYTIDTNDLSPTSSSSSLSPSPSSIPITSNIASEPSIIVHTTVSTSSALLKDNALAFSTVRNTLQAMTQVIHTKQQQVQQQQQQEQLELTLLTALDDAVSYTIDTNDLSPDDHTTMSMMGTIQQIESTIQFKTTMIQESSLPTSTATTPLPLPISINNTHHDNQTDIEEVVINTTDLDSLSLLTSTISSQETIPNINPLHSSSSSSSSSSSMRTVSKPSSIDEELSHYTQLLEEAVLIRNSLQDLEDIEAKKLRQVSVLIFFLIGYILIFLSFIFVSIKKHIYL